MDIQGKTALITGASRGIGKEIALELAQARGEHLTFAISIYTYCNKSCISGLLAKIGSSN